MASNGNNHPSNQLNKDWSAAPGPTGDDRSPRPPKLDTESRVLNIIHKNNDRVPAPVSQESHSWQQPLKLPVVNSLLSAEAPEFIPSAQSGYQGQLFYTDQSAPLSAAAAEFVPAEDYGYDYYQNADYLAAGFGNMNLGYGAGNTGDPILDKFNETLCILNNHPANMEEYLRPICELIQTNQGGNTDVDNMVESLFEQSIQEANFRYTGARICQYLSTHLNDTPQFNGFHKTFIRRCQKEFHRKDELLEGRPEDQERLRGLVMFMAEVFLNVQVIGQDGSATRLGFLPLALMDLAQSVLSKPNDPNIKCLCQLFKLSGALIEDEVKNKADECIKFEELFSSLQSLQKSSISEDAKLRLKSVIDLKEANWNRNNSSPPKNSTDFNSDLDSFQSQEPVFFNNMGERCSRLEANFPDEDYNDNFHVLNDEEEEAFKQFEEEQKKLVGDYSSNDTGYDSYNFGDGGDMGEEAEAAYEEFLQEQYQMLQQQQQQQQEQQQRNHHHNFYQQPHAYNQHQAPPNMAQRFFSYNPQQPPPQHNYPPQLYSQQDPQFHGHMAPGMNSQQYMQQQQYQQPQQPQQQQQNPYGYPN